MMNTEVQNLKQFGTKNVGSGLSRLTDAIFEKGQGSWLHTSEGKWLDFSSGIGVTNLGHCHPQINKAAIDQINTLVHGQCTIGISKTYAELIKHLLTVMPHPSLDTFLFFNSGSEAIDNVIKVVRQYTRRQNIICMKGAFHGRTAGSSALSKSKTAYTQEVLPVMPGVFGTTFPYWHQMGLPADTNEEVLVEKALFDLEFLLATETNPKDTAAIVIEPVLGEGGYVPAPESFLKGLREICDKYEILLAIDEVQTGYGRTGTTFAIEESGVKPDILVFAKGLANGFPLSGISGPEKIMKAMTPGTQGGTYSGSAISCSAAIAVHKVFKEENILENVKFRSNELLKCLKELKDSSQGSKLIADIRGRGLMIGIEFKSSKFTIPGDKFDYKDIGPRIQKKCLSKGLLLLTTSIYDTIRFIPPLNITKEDMKKGLDIFSESFYEVAAELETN